jgi:uncharacterized membrane protein (UPF0136 family)
MANIILWIYIALLVAGGLMGFLKAGSKISLISSLVFAVLLALFAAGIIPWVPGADILLLLLVAVFLMRYVKTKKFMPSGLMIVLTLLALALRFFITRAG